ncbi:tryptophan synthase subunit alpha [Lactobacillus helveticus]|jgi:tryptophan synthase alpha chain|uniref:Tryptophan synthase alpha chain n=1 Tax=Lactobacillus helveticus TaxID=1587 RepID=A0A3Q8SUM4_LACHE|nr:tryptophan synthase subunit alpha [Lactobacillus helveticus]AFR22924.1 tryptophan synthase subunit alpha [Lactobacillus helveticus R0052]AZK91611.1 Tryptophan synthase alpha chain [Lactobacillus helveticus]MCJ2190118.1 tryptophan synthase subunit alpha [Lactobacillus helveticus]MED7627808.1 tryptophan synthase subunit alpha [Lactobacillus helveticus]MZR05411.1 tryptophan synthase subunit alpha [Lactobacillus helveticus]
MSNLSEIFKNHKAFIPFVVADDPDFDTTVKNVVALANAGADIVELGIPFSDPVADGPVIQAADLRAFDAKVRTKTVFEIVEAARKQTDVPIVFLTYLNIVFKYGYDAFLKRCADLDVSGLVIPDLPYESRDEIVPIAEKYNIDIIPLITLTSGHRIEKIAKSASGFIYVVSSLGITGERNEFFNGLKDLVANIKQYTDVPTAIGFGVHTPEQARTMAEIADGVIIGSAIVDIVAKEKQQAPAAVGKFTKQIREAVNSVKQVPVK